MSVRVAILMILASWSAPCAAETLPTASPESVGLSTARLARISARMDQHVANRDVPGVMTVVVRQGRVVHLHLAGYQDVETKQPLRRDTIFRIYSMTKPVTAVAALMLYEQGRFQMTDPVSKFIPEFAGAKVFVGGTAARPELVDAERPITIRDLFTHTACMSYPFTDSPVDQLYKAADLFNGRRTSAEFVAAVARLPLRCQPGSRFAYGVSTDVLGRVVEVLSGQPLDVFMARHIFEPLGMKDTGFFVPRAKRGRLMTLYNRGVNGGVNPAGADPRVGFDTKPIMASGGGGLVSTVDDYLAFTEMLQRGGAFNGARLLSPRTVAFMLSDHGDSAQQIAPGYGPGLGLGVLHDPIKHGRLGEPGEASWAGLANTYFWISPESKTTFMAWTQLFPWAAPAFRSEMAPLVYGAEVK